SAGGATPTSTDRSSPAKATETQAAMSLSGAPISRARRLPVPRGTSATGMPVPCITSATARTVPSPPATITTAGAAASVLRCGPARVVGRGPARVVAAGLVPARLRPPVLGLILRDHGAKPLQRGLHRVVDDGGVPSPGCRVVVRAHCGAAVK